MKMSERKNPHRFVAVGSSGENFLTIETNCLSGSPIGEREEETIRWAINNLTGFIGGDAPVNRPPFIFRRYINGEERAEGIGVETVDTLEEAMPIAVRLCPRRPSECAVLVLERLAVPDPRDVTIDQLRGALRWFLTDDRFQVAIGGNPNVVDRMLADARSILAKASA
jgi:hypothetical protein